MPRQPLPSGPVALYCLLDDLPPEDRVKRADGVTTAYDGPVTINGVQAHLVAGVRAADGPARAERTTGREPDPRGATPFAVVLVPVGGRVLAAAFGSGRHLLDGAPADERPGPLFAIRRLDPARLRAISRTPPAPTARTGHAPSPAGGTPAGSRPGPAGEADVADPAHHGATGGKRCRVRADDPPTTRAGRPPGAFLAGLAAVCRAVEEDDENSPLRFLSRVRPLGDHDPVVPRLEGRLAVALGGGDEFGPLGLCPPAAASRAADVANSFYTNSVGGLGPVGLGADLDVAAITGRFAAVPVSARVSELKVSRLMPCADEHREQLLTRPIPMDRWVAFETEVDGRAYCLHQGRWYGVGRDAVERVRARAAELVANRSDLEFPPWTPAGGPGDEHRYCRRVARRDGYLCPDRDFARTPMHPRLRLADVIGPGDEVVHVGWLGRATAAGRLFARARVSAWAQRLEPEALAQLDAEVRRLDGRRRVTERPRVVVLAAAGRRWDVDRLFTFSLVDLLRLAEDLRHHGISLQFADIPSAPEEGGGRAA